MSSLRRSEVEELHVGSDVAVQAERSRGFQIAPQHLAWITLERRAIEVVDVAEHARLGHFRVAPREDLEGVGVRDGEHVALLDAAEAIDRRAIEGHSVFERVLEFGGTDRKAL